MKLLKRIVALSLVTIVVFYAIFFYINKYVLTSDNIKISSQKVETKSLVKPIKVYIPNFARDVKASFDGSYAAYEENNLLYIVNIQSGEKKKIDLNNKLSFFSWLPDRNRILIITNSKNNNKKIFKLNYYDADRDETGIISDFNAADETMEIRNVKVSTLTNSIFIKAVGGNGKTQIYYMNIMKKLKKLKLKTKNIGDIEAIKHKTHLVYEDSIKGKIYISNVAKPLMIDNVKTESLLGVDNEDNVYIGEIKENKIVRIYSESMDSDSTQWIPYELDVPVSKGDIYISGPGGIYINNAIENSIFEVKSKQRIGYTGELLQIIDNGIVSNSDGELIIKEIKAN